MILVFYKLQVPQTLTEVSNNAETTERNESQLNGNVKNGERCFHRPYKPDHTDIKSSRWISMAHSILYTND